MPPVLIATDIRELLPMKRSPGNHVSEIIHRLSVALGKYEERDPGDKPAQLMFETGSAFEDAISDALMKRYATDHPGRYIHGIEMELDGIYGTLDLLDCVDYAVEDVKITKKSLNNDIEGPKFWSNWVQVKSYCHMIGSNIGRLHVGFINGNYARDWSDPLSSWQYRVWEWKWSRQELEANWRMIAQHKHKHRLSG